MLLQESFEFLYYSEMDVGAISAVAVAKID